MIIQTGLWLICAYAVLLAVGVTVAVCIFLLPLMLRAIGIALIGAVQGILFLSAWAVTWLIAFTATIFVISRLTPDSDARIPLIFADLFIVTPLISYFGVRLAMKRLVERMAHRTGR